MKLGFKFSNLCGVYTGWLFITFCGWK
eukprot:GSMAST32.ASY1.ANO1.790.1 assembled CDS